MNLFVSGTDTDVGKTFVSSLLCYLLSQRSRSHYFKPIQAGFPTDSQQVKRLVESLEILEPVYQLKTAASPNRAAAIENVVISKEKIKQVWQQRSEGHWIVEGAGGLLVPINDDEKIIDLIDALNISTLLVASTRLGTINHTLLSVEALKARGLPCAGIVLNGEEDPGLKELIEEQSGVPVVFEVAKVMAPSPSAFDEIFQGNKPLQEFIDGFFVERTDLNVKIETLSQWDRDHVWHPFTQHGIVKNHPVVSKGEGAYLFLEDKKVIDAVSSWWVNLLGHCHPRLVEAVRKQVGRLDHVIFAGFSHEPAIQLSKTLTELCKSAGTPLEKVFFSDNGSTSVEVALKMAFQYHQQNGDLDRKRFLAFHGSYHGDTLGAMSVGERKGFNQVFTPLMFEVDFVDPFNFDEVEGLLEKRGHLYAGVIFEPMVQGASGMRMYDVSVLNRLQELCGKKGVFKICDEVFTGFYRTGKCFAFEHSVLKPDFLCLSKGLTGGFLPLSATLTSDEIYRKFENQDMRYAFLHGHSYTANPIACAVANATLAELFHDQTLEKIAQIEMWTRDCVSELSKLDLFFNGRSLGTIGALEVSDEDPNYFKGDFSYRFNQAALKRGVLLRPLGGTIYAVPPYCIERQEIEKVYDVMLSVLKEEF